MPIIKLHNISKEFPSGDTNVLVLKNITLEINSGEITMIVGPSGCGKTTLISIITGILKPTSGEVQILDKNITKMKDSENVLFRRKNIGFIFQQYNLLPALTVVENAAIPLLADGVKNKIAESRAEHVLKKVGLGEHLEKLPNQLSGGQQQRVSISRAIVHKPKIIVCDEPTAALDATSGKKVMEILKSSANDKERAVIIVTHDNRIHNFADRIIHMSDGEIVKDERINKSLETQENSSFKREELW
jgi:putative ABC transport system ATP-binding protein